MNQTYVTLAGLVATKPEAKMVNGTRLLSFRLVATERRFDPASGSWVDRDSTWATVTCWRALAVNVERSVTWKDKVLVRGRMHTREWLQDGVRRTELRITADAVGPDLNYGTSTYTRTQRVETNELEVAADELAAIVEDLPVPPLEHPDGAALPVQSASRYEPDDLDEEADEDEDGLREGGELVGAGAR